MTIADTIITRTTSMKLFPKIKNVLFFPERFYFPDPSRSLRTIGLVGLLLIQIFQHFSTHRAHFVMEYSN